MTTSPIIAIDGPSASGKGTVAAQVAQRLNFHYLDSGAIYRALAWYAQSKSVTWDNIPALTQLAIQLPITFKGNEVWLKNQNISTAIRTEAIGVGASEVSAHADVRAALLQRQRLYCQPPGLVADGRDMGSVVFPEATLKIFLTASAQERAQRRYKQLINKGESANLAMIEQGIIERDQRDSKRFTSPLLQASDAILLDTTMMTIEQAVAFVINSYHKMAKTMC